MRGGKGLVQVEMHDVDAQIARADNTQQGIQVGAIAIDQTAGLVDDLDDFQHILVEQTERIGVGQHQTGHGIIAQAFERGQIHIAASIGGRARLRIRSWQKWPGWCRGQNRG